MSAPNAGNGGGGGGGDATVITEDSDARRAAVLRHWLQRSAHRMAGDCERMLDALGAPERKEWRDAVGQALVASRHLLALVSGLKDAPLSQQVSLEIESLTARIEEPRRRIIDALTPLLHAVPVRAEDELLLLDVRSVRDSAHNLFAAPEPLAATNGSSSAPATAQPPARSATPRILVVDDEKLMRSVLHRHIAKLGYDVILAENGKEGFELAQREAVDLILSDINMPKLDGIELLRLLKATETTRHVPVIMISSQDDLRSVARCIELGAEDHIAKPYEPMLLQARISASLERKQLRDLELDHLRRVAMLTSAAETVEREAYVSGSLRELVARDDELGRLARVFDRMVSGLKSREQRLQHRLRELRREMGGAVTGSDAAAVSAESPFASGEILAARYEIRGRLGKGGMGMVYNALDRELGEEVAVKVVRGDIVARDPGMVERLKSEIRLTRRISHRNVVRAHDLGEWKGTYFITMELVKGITVAELIDRRGRLTVDSTLAIGSQLAEALAVAHEEQIIHRDIKPANLLIDAAGVLKVMDFGIARLIERDANLTLGGFIVGTPQYMAPEQLMGGSVDARADLFSVGVVLYECLAGKPPFVEESPLALMAAMTEANYPRLRDVVAQVPARVEALIDKLLQLQPSARVGSARELANTLGELEQSG